MFKVLLGFCESNRITLVRVLKRLMSIHLHVHASQETIENIPKELILSDVRDSIRSYIPFSEKNLCELSQNHAPKVEYPIRTMPTLSKGTLLKAFRVFIIMRRSKLSQHHTNTTILLDLDCQLVNTLGQE